ncbi:Cysteine-rich receptor-like protein kinase 29 [Platanthera guangdongensis]|uniref:Cysteine-rich receptor-like protein kinase 29 n=1 Tax=Platanthera guangdongensis TaxID=2320717 RepID=A0ABR2LW38_9ASPA
MKNQQVFFSFLLFVVSLPISTLAADSELLYPQCDQNFTQNHVLQSNIDNLLIDMAAQSSLHRFAISTFGGGGYDAVYGVARCDGDMSHEACSACITRAEHDILAACPGSGAVHAWHEKCYLHYDVTNFIGKWDHNTPAVWISSSKAEDPKAFEQGVAELMGEVMAEAAGERITLKFKSGKSSLKGYNDSSLTIYGMAQCTQDLQESECIQCLESSLKTMAEYCKGSDDCRIFGSSCVLRYEIYKFLWLDDVAGAEAPAPASSIADRY